jgi:hypothetical protein
MLIAQHRRLGWPSLALLRQVLLTDTEVLNDADERLMFDEKTEITCWCDRWAWKDRTVSQID